MIIDKLASASTILRETWNASFEQGNLSLTDPAAWDEVFGTSSSSGESVTPHKALSIPAIWQCLSLLGGDVASIPFHPFRKQQNGDKIKDESHPADTLVSVQANEETSAFEFWRKLVVHAGLYSNGYAYIQRVGRVGKPTALINLLPDRTAPMRDGEGNLYYVTEVAGREEILLKEEVFHLRGPISIFTERAVDLLNAAKDTIGLALASRDFKSKFFANGAKISGILEIPPGFSPEAREGLERSFNKEFTSKQQWFKTAVLRDGAKFHKASVSARESQQKDLDEAIVREVSRLYNIPPMKLGLADSVSYNSIESLQLVYLSSALRHWLGAIKAEANLKLLTYPQRIRLKTHTFEHNITDILEVEIETLNTVLEKQRQNMVITANDWRRKLNMNSSSDPTADLLFNPNTMSLEDMQALITGEPTKSDDNTNDDIDTDDNDVDPKTKNITQATIKSEGETDLLPPKVKTASESLLNKTLSDFSKRVGIQAIKKSSNSSKFATFLDEKLGKEEEILTIKIEPILNVVAAHFNDEYDEYDIHHRSIVAAKTFINSYKTIFNNICNPPYSVADLENNVETACRKLERDVPTKVTSLIIDLFTLDSNEESTDA